MFLDLVVVLLLSGYISIIFDPYQKFRLDRTSGWLTYLYAACRGLLFSVPAAAVILIARKHAFSEAELAGIPREAFFIAWGLLSCLMAFCFGVFPRRDRQLKACRKVSEKSELRAMLWRATQDSELVQVTLSSRKVYIGSVHGISRDFMNSKMDYIALVPMLSGYRTESNLKLKLMTSYTEYFKNLKESDPDRLFSSISRFTILIAVKDVVHIGLFDLDAYSKINETRPTKNVTHVTHSTSG